MVVRLDRKKILAFVITGVAVWVGVIITLLFASAEKQQSRNTYIKWAEMNVSFDALRDTMELDIGTYDKLYHISWVDSLAYLAVKNGNDFSRYKKDDLGKMLSSLGESYTVDDLMQGNKYFDYYRQIFSAILGGLLGEYEKQAPDGEGGKKIVKGYGLVAYSPIAEGFSYSHYDDFGNSRTYGYKRQHLGNDLLGFVGTPIVAVEGGTVECIGWNRYGGWRLGIRSFDGKRSYYYAHLRKDSPYHSDIHEGSLVKAGQVIGYMGMTGYSQKTNVNGMTTPHLHLGLQLIFDESQKEGENQIWLDVYNLVRLLSQNRATVIKNEDTKQYFRKYDIIDYRYPDPLLKYVN